MCICVNRPNEHNFTKKNIASPFQHPPVTSLPTHILFFVWECQSGQDFYEFSSFFSNHKSTHISNHPLYQTTLQYSHPLFMIPYLYDVNPYRIIHSNGIFIITHSKYIHDITQRGCIQDYNFCMSNTVPQKKSLKRKLKHVKKWVFLGGERCIRIKKCRKTRVNKKYWEREKNMRIDSKINTGRQCLWERFFFFQQTGRWSFSFFFCFF